MTEKRSKPDGYQLRFPPRMRDRLKRKADENSRSLNAEIISRLEYSLSSLPNADLVRILLDFNEKLLAGNAEELVLLPGIQSEIRRLAEDRGLSPQMFASRLVIEAIEQIEQNSELGQELAARVAEGLQLDEEYEKGERDYLEGKE